CGAFDPGRRRTGRRLRAQRRPPPGRGLARLRLSALAGGRADPSGAAETPAARHHGGASEGPHSLRPGPDLQPPQPEGGAFPRRGERTLPARQPSRLVARGDLDRGRFSRRRPLGALGATAPMAATPPPLRTLGPLDRRRLRPGPRRPRPAVDRGRVTPRNHLPAAIPHPGCKRPAPRERFLPMRPFLLLPLLATVATARPDRKSTRLNSSHVNSSYA